VIRAAVLGVFVAVVLCAPAWVRGELVGATGAETFGHAWVLGWATEAWPAWAAGTDLAAGARDWPVIDPAPTWLAAGAAKVMGVDAAWNLRVAVAIVLAAVGGARLARAWGGDETFAAVATPVMPIFLGSITSGLSEDLGVGLLGFVLAWGLEGRWWRAALGVGLLATTGLYLAWMGGVALAALAVRAGLGDGRSLAVRAGALLLAAGLAAGVAKPFAGRLAAAAKPPPPAVEPHYRLNPWRGADVLSFVAPGKDTLDGASLREHPTYLGLVSLGLAVAGATPAGCTAVLACVAASAGDELSVAGTPTGVHNPAADLVRALPGGDQLRNRARLMLLGQLVLVGLASRGVLRLRGRWRGAAGVAAAALVAAEVAFVSPARLPLPGVPTEGPPIYAALAVAPAGLPVRVVGSQNPQAPLFHQRAHGRRLRNDPNRPDPGRPDPDSEIIVAFGDTRARLEAELGAPDAQADDAAAWWPG
jgi:hypothetical protein